MASRCAGLIDGGADLLLIETIFDTLNAKAAIYAIAEACDERGRRRAGDDLRHHHRPLRPPAVGPDAGGVLEFGAPRHPGHHRAQLRARRPARCAPISPRSAALADTFVCAYPNAGLPNEFGYYDESPEYMAELLGEFAEAGLVNVVGGCCGTTPEHIAAIAKAVAGKAPRAIPEVPRQLRLSGLEAFTLTPEIPFVNVGERTNVTGSAKFRKLITAGDYAGALAIAREQVENGAQVIDVNMDEGLLDSEAAMVTFLNLIAAEPDIARVPVMVDSSKFSVIEAGLKCLQGKPVVNSISMKEGEAAFIEHAKIVRRYGAAVVVMAFDEKGQADTFERKTAICKRAYDILVNQVGFPPEDIIFDPNIFAIATGMEEHNNYGVDFIEAARWIKANLPHVHVSGGVSNLSFSFRGNERVREAMHSVFLYHAIKAGMDMGIVNAGQIAVYDDLDPELREACEDVVLNRRPDAAERLLALAEKFRGAGQAAKEADLAWREQPVEKRLAHALVHGITDFIEADIEEARLRSQAPARRDRRPADGRHEHRRRPVRLRQDVPAAGGEVGARDEAGGRLSDAVHGGGKGARRGGDAQSSSNGKIVMATVKGDVHDIGKNIVGVVLQCNNYEVIDLGVMVPAAKILETARAEKADIIGLSGLITPSLDEMCHVAAEMERQGFDLPLLIGGATTSRVHTAVKIHPNYQRGQAVYVNDASRAVGVAQALMSARGQARLCRRAARRIRQHRRRACARAGGQGAAAARRRARQCAQARLVGRLSCRRKPTFLGTKTLADYPIAELVDFIDWTPFFQTWELTGKFPAILDDAKFGQAARALYRRRARDARQDRRRELVHGQRRVRLLAGQCAGRRHPRLMPTRRASDADRGAAHAAPAAGQARGPRQRGARRFRRAARQRARRLHRRLRRHRRHRRGRGRRALQARQRRLLRDPGQGAGRPAGRSLRRAAAPARAQGILGLRAGRGARAATT